jgi:hypothetical protein
MAEKRKGKVKEVSEKELKSKLSSKPVADKKAPAKKAAPAKKSSKPADQRADPRIAAQLAVEVPLATVDQLRRVYTSNISKGGLLFSLVGPAKIAAEIDLTLRLPDDTTVTIPCEVRHVAPRDGGEYEVGVQFVGLDAATRKSIEAAIDRLG